MIVAVIFLSLALLVILGFALRYVYRRFQLSFEQEEQVAALEGQALVLSLREKLTYEFLAEMKRSRVVEGKAEGYREIVQTMPAIYGRHFDAIISQMGEHTKTIVEGEIAKHKLLLGMGDINALKDQIDNATSNNRILRDNQDELTKQRDNWKRRYETLKEIEAGLNLVQSPSKGGEKPVESRNEGGEELVQRWSKPALDPVPAAPMQGKIRSLAKEYHYDDSSRNYYFDFEERAEGLTVLLKRKADDQTIGRFAQSLLKAGETMEVGGKHVVLCGLPRCTTVKITQQSTTRCCCRDHTAALRKLEAEDSRLTGND